ncbi:MAG: type 1 glutamine amidotransferase [Thiobacillus sp.]|nr:type 1 glutamine amidotransferase [Thiobacillus sp.]
MRPVAIFRHVGHEGPGRLGDFLDSRGIARELIAVDRGDAIPDSPAAYAGLVFMGGPMSVNDDLAWIPRSLELIRRAVAADIPVLGHCLGGQLIAKALGGAISGNPVKEIGWGEARVVACPEAAAWFGDLRAFPAFHWHGETFSIPEGAVRILETPYCPNQAFVLGKHLALQCHVEMTAEMIEEWCQAGADEIAAASSPAVQGREAILAGIASHLAAMAAVADRLYGHWVAGLSR